MFSTIRNIMSDESGATAIEYGLIAALVSVAAIAALGDRGDALTRIFGVASTKLNGAADEAEATGGTEG